MKGFTKYDTSILIADLWVGREVKLAKLDSCSTKAETPKRHETWSLKMSTLIKGMVFVQSSPVRGLDGDKALGFHETARLRGIA